MVIALFSDKSKELEDLARDGFYIQNAPDHIKNWLQTCQDFYSHYLCAPVAACIFREGDCVSEEFVTNKFGDHIKYMTTDNFDGSNIIAAFEAGKTKYAEKKQNDV